MRRAHDFKRASQQQQYYQLPLEIRIAPKTTTSSTSCSPNNMFFTACKPSKLPTSASSSRYKRGMFLYMPGLHLSDSPTSSNRTSSLTKPSEQSITPLKTIPDTLSLHQQLQLQNYNTKESPENIAVPIDSIKIEKPLAYSSNSTNMIYLNQLNMRPAYTDASSERRKQRKSNAEESMVTEHNYRVSVPRERPSPAPVQHQQQQHKLYAQVEEKKQAAHSTSEPEKPRYQEQKQAKENIMSGFTANPPQQSRRQMTLPEIPVDFSELQRQQYARRNPKEKLMSQGQFDENTLKVISESMMNIRQNAAKFNQNLRTLNTENDTVRFIQIVDKPQSNHRLYTEQTAHANTESILEPSRNRRISSFTLQPLQQLSKTVAATGSSQEGIEEIGGTSTAVSGSMFKDTLRYKLPRRASEVNVEQSFGYNIDSLQSTVVTAPSYSKDASNNNYQQVQQQHGSVNGLGRFRKETSLGDIAPSQSNNKHLQKDEQSYENNAGKKKQHRVIILKDCVQLKTGKKREEEEESSVG